MQQINSFYFQCISCAASASQRFHIRGGAICRDCYERFARVTAEPMATWTVENLQDLERTKNVAPTLIVVKAPMPVPAPSTAVTPKLSVIKSLQFKKYIRENSGMTAAEVDEYLKGIADDERAELMSAFLLTITQNTSAVDPISQGAMPLAVAPPLQARQSNSSAVPSVHILTENANQPACPKCRSTKTTFSKQGFGVGKAAIGAVLTGGIGLLAGGIGANKIRLTCLECGNTWSKG